MQPISFWDDAHTQLSTPEQVDLQLEVANVGSRGLAFLADTILRYTVFLLLYFILALVTDFRLFESEMNLGLKAFAVLFIFIVFISEWFYFTLFEWMWNGQTPGKRLLHLRVIKMDGSPVSWLEVVLRNFTRPIDTTGPMALLGIAFIFFQPRGQRPGDLAARTIVIRETPIDWSSFFPKDSTNQASAVTIPLLPQEVEMLQRFIQRDLSAAPKIRKELSTKIRSTLQPRTMGTELENSSLPDEEWLKALAKRL